MISTVAYSVHQPLVVTLTGLLGCLWEAGCFACFLLVLLTTPSVEIIGQGSKPVVLLFLFAVPYMLVGLYVV